MKIVCISDTHTFHNAIPIPDGDVFIHAGDFTFGGREEEVKSFAEFLKKLPHKHKIVIAGNHDVSFQRNPEEARKWLGDCIYLENDGVEIEGIKIWGSPYHPWFTDVWAFGMKNVRERRANWDKIPEKTDVLITHGPPRGIFDTNLGEKLLLGDIELLDAVKRIKPKIHVFGHIHNGGGKSENIDGTIFANIACLNENYQIVRGAFIVEVEKEKK